MLGQSMHPAFLSPLTATGMCCNNNSSSSSSSSSTTKHEATALAAAAVKVAATLGHCPVPLLLQVCTCVWCVGVMIFVEEEGGVEKRGPRGGVCVGGGGGFFFSTYGPSTSGFCFEVMLCQSA